MTDIESGERPRMMSANGPDFLLTWNDLKFEVDVPTKGAGPCPSLGARCGRKVETEKKTILSDISGFAAPGELIALMGASGAGKTSLLNILAGLNTDFTGSVLINGRPITKGMRKHVAFCQQEDLFIGTLKVEEHLRFQARLRMPASTSDAKVEERVQEMLREMNLAKCRDTVIGTEMLKGISGGEKKRLSFSSESINHPSLFFADEPTSGLDSFMAEAVVRSLRAMAQSGRTVIATIHQPSSQVYALFDKVMFLAEGRVAYFGPRAGALSYFRELGHPCPEYMNPADAFIYTLSVVPSHVAESKSRIRAITDAYLASRINQTQREGVAKVKTAAGREGRVNTRSLTADLLDAEQALFAAMEEEAAERAAADKAAAERAAADKAAGEGEGADEAAGKGSEGDSAAAAAVGETETEAEAEGKAAQSESEAEGKAADGGAAAAGVAAAAAAPVEIPPTPAVPKEEEEEEEDERKYSVGFLTQTGMLTKRAFLASMRDPLLTKARMGQTIVLSLIASMIYSDTGRNQAGVQSLSGAMFFLLINQSFSGVFGVLQTFPLEIPVFLREHKGRLYAVFPYYLAKSLADLPFQVVFPIIFCCIAYPLIGFRDGFGHFCVFVGTIVLCAQAAFSLGYLISCISKTVGVALALGPLILLPFLLFGGFFVSPDAIPSWLKWIGDLSFFNYAFAVLMKNEFDGVTGISCETMVVDPATNATVPGQGCVLNGDQVLARYALTDINIANEIWALVGLLFAFRTVAFLALYWRSYSKPF